MTTKPDITPLTKIADLLDAYPQLEDELIAQAPAFKRLKNPVLRRTVARVATIEKAAIIAGIPVPDLVRTLRRAAGLDVGTEVESASSTPGVSESPEALPDWIDESRIRETIDADALLNQGIVPIATILKAAKELEGPAILRVVSSFVPAPLTEKLESSGFQTHTHRSTPDRHETYIRPGHPH